jgi:hypothetical protein
VYQCTTLSTRSLYVFEEEEMWYPLSPINAEYRENPLCVLSHPSYSGSTTLHRPVPAPCTLSCHAYRASIKTAAPIHIICRLVLQLSIPAPPNPSPGFASGFGFPRPDPLLPFPWIGVPGILVKLFADAANADSFNRVLFNEAQDGLLSWAGILFVTWIGRSKIVYSSDPFRRKFCRMEILFHQRSSCQYTFKRHIHYTAPERNYYSQAVHCQRDNLATPN